MEDLYKKVKVSPLHGDRFLLLEEFKFNDGIEDITVPKNYITNGADIPRIFWSLIPPNKSDILPAVILHDFLCDKEQYKKADEVFEKALKHCRVKKIYVSVMIRAVRFYHRIKYKVK